MADDLASQDIAGPGTIGSDDEPDESDEGPTYDFLYDKLAVSFVFVSNLDSYFPIWQSFTQSKALSI
jgi:hypothetical protein